MIQGVSGSFDIACSNPSTFTARIFYSEQYDKATGKHIVGITGISIRSTEFGHSWYPHGTIAIDGAVVGTMDNSNPASHTVSLTAGSGWHVVNLTTEGRYNGFKDFPWDSGEIRSNPDGTKTVEIVVDFLLYRDSSAPRPSFKGFFSVELTPTPAGLAYIDTGAENMPCQICIDNGGAFDRYMAYADNGSAWDPLNS